MDKLKNKIREIKDFPTPGINFKDITPLLEDAASFKESIDKLTIFLKNKEIDKIVGVDARGFLLAAPVAYALKVGMVIVRKKGKLPYETIIREHDLEYGSSVLEIHTDSIKAGERIAIIDDVLATGGTIGAAIHLVEQLKGIVVGLGFLADINLGGREKLKDYDFFAVIRY